EVKNAYIAFFLILATISILGYTYMVILTNPNAILKPRFFHIYFIIQSFLGTLNAWQLAILTFIWNFALAHVIISISYILKKRGASLERTSILLFTLALLYGIFLQQIANIQILYPHYYFENRSLFLDSSHF
ncbi:MAG: hypothetical protein DRJ38_08640, partial [Thermoprotei archaeon]